MTVAVAEMVVSEGMAAVGRVRSDAIFGMGEKCMTYDYVLCSITGELLKVFLCMQKSCSG